MNKKQCQHYQRITGIIIHTLKKIKKVKYNGDKKMCKQIKDYKKIARFRYEAALKRVDIIFKKNPKPKLIKGNELDVVSDYILEYEKVNKI